jgi:hypothetical protein
MGTFASDNSKSQRPSSGLEPESVVPHTVVQTTEPLENPVYNRLSVPLTILIKPPISVVALVDTGSDLSHVDQSFIENHHLVPTTLNSPISVETVDGRILASGPITEFVTLSCLWNGNAKPFNFHVISSPHASVILGLDWLRMFQPTIDLSNFSVLSSSSAGHDPAESKTCFVGASISDSVSIDGSRLLESPRTSYFANGLNEYSTNTVFGSKVKEPLEVSNDNPAETFDLPFVDDIPASSLDFESIKEKLPDAYHSFANVFCKVESEQLPEHRKYDISIDIKPDSVVPWGPIYGLSEPELKVLREYLDENLKKNYIRPSKSPAGAPIFFVKKKDGSLRPVVDFRGLNNVTVKNRYPLPLINEIMSRFRTAKVFTKIDLRGAYNLVRVKTGDEWKTAFRCRYGHFEYNVMPFGLTNAPAVFQHLMNDIFRDLLDLFVVIYLDDILIYSENYADHDIHVKKVLSRLQVHHLYAKLEKCVFSTSSIDFLGYVISDKGLAMEPTRIDVIKSWPVPNSVRDVQVFLGFANFYRNFVSSYSSLITPLTTLLRKNQAFHWSDACQDSFDQLKLAFSSQPLLRHADSNKAFVVETDASDFAISGILSQLDDNDVLHPVAYFSRKLTSPEANYEIHDKELLAIIASFHRWRPFLSGSRFPVTVYTDHKNLEYFGVSRKLNRRQVRWSLFLTDYDYQIVYRPGKEGGKPDALSRRSDFGYHQLDDQVQQQTRELIPKSRLIMGLATLDTTPLLENIKKEQELDPFILKSKSSSDDRLTIADGLYMYNGRIMVPSSLRLSVMKLCHDTLPSGHLGIRKSLSLVARTYWWPTFRKDVTNFVSSCQTCAMAKTTRSKPAGLLMPLPVPPRPWFSLSMDMVTDLPVTKDKFDSILVVVDRFSKMAHFIPCTKTLSSNGLAILFLKNVFRIHGLPNNIVSDRGSIFVSQFWSALMKHLKIRQNLSSAYHPQSDGQTERVNQTVEQYLRCFSDYQQTNWSENLPLAEYSYNSAEHSATNQSPFLINYGYNPVFEISTELIPDEPPTASHRIKEITNNIEMIRTELELAQENQKHFANKSRRELVLEVGQMVYLNRKNIRTTRPCLKLDWKRFGPFKIIKKINDVAFQLQLPQSMKLLHDTFHVSLLEPATQNTLENRTDVIPDPIVIDQHEEYEVDEILDSRVIRRKLQYLVSWRGYGPSENTWQVKSDLDNCARLLKEFHEQFPNKPGP